MQKSPADEKMTKSGSISLKKSDAPSPGLPVICTPGGTDFFRAFHYTGFLTPFFQMAGQFKGNFSMVKS